jgi:subtilisin family serine protease
MSRPVSLLALSVAVLALGADVRSPALAAGDVRVVVQLSTPPLAVAPSGTVPLLAEQRAFQAALRERLPEARVDHRYRLVANGLALTLPQADTERLRALPGVTDVLPSAEYGIQLDGTPERIGAQALWGAGLETAGDGIKIGIVDTGVDARHPFFQPAGYAMPAGFPKGQTRFTTAKVIVARAFPPPRSRAPGARLAFDGIASSHGTHVAGIAAGNARTRADGGRIVSGIAPRAYIGNYKALVRTEQGLSPNGNSPEIVAAIEAAVRDGMDVLNLSIGEPEIEPSRDIVARALDAAAAAGVVPVVAAGNDFVDLGAGTISSPANSARSISVAAVELGGTPAATRLAEFSSAGPTTLSLRLKPDVAAPGIEILSAVPGDDWASFSGTSMAAPHVAGAAALLRDRHPAWSVTQVKSALVQSGTSVVDDRGRIVGPQFQGGGVITLTEADRPLVFSGPAGVSFGLVQPGARVQGALALQTLGAGAGTWDVSHVPARSSTGRAELALPAAVEVPGTLAYVLSVPMSGAQGDVTGFVVLRRGTDVRRVPYWGRVSQPALGRHTARTLREPGVYQGTTRGRAALVTSYRYPENPRGVGVTTVLRGPELVVRFLLARSAANFGVVVTQRAPGVGVEPRVVSRMDENRLTGYAGLPMHHNPYLDGFRSPVPAAGALSPRGGEYAIVFDSRTRGGAGRFRFRIWLNDVTPPTLRVRSRTSGRAAELLVSATDAGSGVYPASIRVRVDGAAVPYVFRRGLIRIPTADLGAGRHRLEIRASDYQETKNTENVRRILPNTRTVRTTFTVR